MTTSIDACKKKHQEILWPTVRIRAEKAWGSGTVIYSGKIGAGQFVTYVITCHHVIADNIKIEKKFDHRVGYDIKRENRVPAEVEFFYYENLSKCGGIAGSCKADIVAYDEDGDIALLELKKTVEVDPVATLFPLDKVKEIHVFDDTWACGAALAHEPITTKGIINFMNEILDNGIEYWMSSAQIIFGNSGGSIFRYSEERDKYEFLGIPARISISMNGFSADPITHMGFFVPITRIYKFLDDNFYSFIHNKEETYESCKAKREKYVLENEKLLLAKFGGAPETEDPKRRPPQIHP
jgi:S1-C subfamily serine protease